MLETSFPDLPAFATLDGLLDDQHPAEVHGMLCGMLCIDVSTQREDWLRWVNPRNLPLTEDSVLHRVFAVTHQQLSEASFDFALLLPDDDACLFDRANSLGFWCQGFVAGLSLAGLKADSELPEDVHEFITDVDKFSQVGFIDTGSTDEEDEIAYTEIVEYLRVGVLLMCQELHPGTYHPHAQRLH